MAAAFHILQPARVGQQVPQLWGQVCFGLVNAHAKARQGPAQGGGAGRPAAPLPRPSRSTSGKGPTQRRPVREIYLCRDSSCHASHDTGGHPGRRQIRHAGAIRRSHGWRRRSSWADHRPNQLVLALISKGGAGIMGQCDAEPQIGGHARGGGYAMRGGQAADHQGSHTCVPQMGFRARYR